MWPTEESPEEINECKHCGSTLTDNEKRCVGDACIKCQYQIDVKRLNDEC